MRINILVIIFFTFISCSKDKVEEKLDGIYCADVYYYNNISGKKAELTIPVLVRNNQLIKFEDSWLDEVVFEPKLLTDNTATFNIQEDELIGVLILGKKNCREYVNFGNEEYLGK